MVIGTRIRQLRESKSLSQGDVEKRTGLLRCYISRVENGHTVPSVETIEKLAGAFEIPLYRFFYEGTEAPKISTPIDRSGKVELNGNSRDAKYIRSLQRCFAKMTASNRATFLALARKMANPPPKKRLDLDPGLVTLTLTDRVRLRLCALRGSDDPVSVQVSFALHECKSY